MRGARGVIAAVFATLALVIAGAAPASAHAVLLRSDPADGAMLKDAPKTLSLTFSEPVSPLVIKVLGPNGAAATPRFEARGPTIAVTVPEALEQGSHALSWRVISADGHPVAGSVVFSIGRPGGGAIVDGPTAADEAVKAAIWTVRVALYLGLFFGVGGVFARSWIGRGRASDRSALAATALGLVAAPVALGLQGVDALGGTLASFLDPLAWRAAVSTTYVWTVAFAVAALALSAISLVARGGIARAASLIGLALAGVSLAASGHASAAEPQWLTRPSVFIHVVAVAFWLGALPALAEGLVRRDVAGLTALRRFSRAAPFAIAPLFVAGVALAVVQLRSVEALWATDYGRVLTAKLALVLGVVLLAALNRWRFTRPAEGGEAGAARNLVRTIGFEIALAVAILGAVGLWRFTPPPRALAATAAEPAQAHFHSLPAMADVTVTPGRAGPVLVSFAVMTGEFGPLDAKEIEVAFSNSAAGIEPIRRQAARNGDGTWSVSGLALPVGGRWHVRLEIRTSEFDVETLEGDVDIR